MKRLKGRIKKLFTGANWNLLREMTRAEFRLSDHNSILGVLWSLINPVLTLAVMYFIFRDRFGKTIHTYPLYLLIGISCVNFFIAATTSLIKVFPDNRGFILNTTAPREIVILAKLFIHTYKFIIELALCLALSLYCGVFSSAGLLAALPLLLSYIALVLSFGLILSVSYCFVSDIGHIWGLLCRLLLFVTPIFYKLDNLSFFFRRIIYWGNPLTAFVISFRGLFINNGTFNFNNYAYAVVLGFLLLVPSYFVFLIFENAAMERA